ncbi:unnamed protein product [Schistocephalus solidus]|uniref:Derlin n=1 Tax=Schistocephalus solidus TaxID=70667 RepID=A0A183SWW0_SCHSO|nr:unnamed protein product [Schistocephalus solidus]
MVEIMTGNDFSDVYYGIPRLTRYWLTGTIVLSLLGKLGLINLFWLILDWSKFFYEFQIWRPVTALFFYPVTPQTGFHFLINLYFLYTYSSRLETGRSSCLSQCFSRIQRTACGICLPLLFEPMVLSVMYVWCQMNREAVVQFWFGTQFKALYFPWALVVFNIIIRGSALMELVGIFVGHVYYFFAHQYPQEFGGPLLLKTPAGRDGCGRKPQNKPYLGGIHVGRT